MTILSYILAFGLIVLLWWLILGKMGFTGVPRLLLAFGILVPGIGLLAEWLYLAFWDWPGDKP